MKNREHGKMVDEAHLVALNFKVPAAFRRQLKTFAARTDRTMVQVLFEGFDLLTEADRVKYQETEQLD